MKLLIPILILAAGSAHAAEINLADSPPAVRTTLEEHRRGGTVDEVEVYLIEGKSLYVAEVDLPDQRDLKIHVRADGTLVKTREDVSQAELPAAVRQAVEAKLAGGTVDDVEKESARGTVTYHVEIDRKGAADLDLVIAEDGKVLRETEEADD